MHNRNVLFYGLSLNIILYEILFQVINANVIVIITIWHQLVMSREECVSQNHNNVNHLYFITKVHLLIILDIFQKKWIF